MFFPSQKKQKNTVALPSNSIHAVSKTWVYFEKFLNFIQNGDMLRSRKIWPIFHHEFYDSKPMEKRMLLLKDSLGTTNCYSIVSCSVICAIVVLIGWKVDGLSSVRNLTGVRSMPTLLYRRFDCFYEKFPGKVREL